MLTRASCHFDSLYLFKILFSVILSLSQKKMEKTTTSKSVGERPTPSYPRGPVITGIFGSPPPCLANSTS